eukprot:CAMPEP_0206254190 /NCGR_PEP_ID=MMETSP0047_2-20121206/23564_1 /ASSEMBLY_ACC=CAM_ASM_000192 /TAXON_ID=195065 /ORGANISM="Chroomonas mesostigmatica_cf, Strain CCMP1168" /LENGTH=128 /DNA_ID=CAMNT_0053680471 /DNA_START=78 /DNA_END=461 /DNA_ORIENTATION=+
MNLAVAAAERFAVAGDKLNSFRAACVRGEALMRLSYVKICNKDFKGTHETLTRPAVESLKTARLMAAELSALGISAQQGNSIPQQFSFSLQMLLEQADRHKKELAGMLAEATDPGEVTAVRTALETVM